MILGLDMICSIIYGRFIKKGGDADGSKSCQEAYEGRI